MVRNSRPTTVPKNEETDHELIENKFKNLIQETKNEEYKAWLKGVSEAFNPENYALDRDLVKTFRRLYLNKTLTICDLLKQLNETKKKLKECQKRAAHKPKLTE